MPIKWSFVANHFKEQEIIELKRQAEEDRRLQIERVAQLEQMVQAQMQHNLKLQSKLESHLAQARPPPMVETAAITLHTRTEVTPPAFGKDSIITSDIQVGASRKALHAYT